MNKPVTISVRLAIRSSYCKCRSQDRRISQARHCLSLRRNYSSEAQLAKPAAEHEEKIFLPKIQKIVDDISNLTLLEVADLNELLKKQLKIQDAPMMAMGAMPVAVAPAEEEEESQTPQKMAYTVKLKGYDKSKKIPLIKAIKSVIPDTNLVQAKKIVESAPIIVKNDLTKDEAETLQKALQEVGGEVEVD